MSKYIFRLDNGELICRKKVKDNTTEFTSEDAVNKLRMIDALKFKRVKITSYGVILENDKTRVFIHDGVLFGENEYQNCLYNNINKIDKAFKKWNKKQVENKHVIPGTIKGVATVGLLVSMGIAIATCTLKNDSYNENIAIEDLDDLEDDMEFEAELVTLADNVLEQNVTIQDEKNEANANSTYEPMEFLDYGIDPEEIPSVDMTTDLLNELNDDGTNLVNISFNDEFDEVKYSHVVSNFFEVTQERASRWGVSTNLALSFISQESGGYVDNLMQIQWNSWAEVPITVFNFEKGITEKIVLTENPENFQNQGITQFISKEELKNPKTNISIGCIILRYSFDQMNNNMTAAIQAYNFGVNNMNKVLDAAANDMGCTREDLLRDQSNTSFLNYRYIIDVGDPNYVENVLRFLQGPNEEISIRFIDENGEEQETSVIINNEESTRKI